MANEIAKRDDNYSPSMLGVTNDANMEIRRVRIDPVTGGILVKIVGGPTGSNIYTASGTLTGNREVDIDGNQMRIGGLLNTTGSVNWGISDPFGQGHNILVNGVVSETKGGIEYSSESAVGDLSGIGITDFGRINAIENDTNDARIFETWNNDDGFGNNSPGFVRQIFNADETIINFFNQNSQETSFGRGGADGADDVSSNFTMDDVRARVKFDRDLANGTTQQGELEAREDYAIIKSQFTDASDDDYRAVVETRHNNGTGMSAKMYTEDPTGELSYLELTDSSVESIINGNSGSDTAILSYGEDAFKAFAPGFLNGAVLGYNQGFTTGDYGFVGSRYVAGQIFNGTFLNIMAQDVEYLGDEYEISMGSYADSNTPSGRFTMDWRKSSNYRSRINMWDSYGDFYISNQVDRSGFVSTPTSTRITAQATAFTSPINTLIDVKKDEITLTVQDTQVARAKTTGFEMQNAIKQLQGDDVSSATNITISGANAFEVTGTTTIDSITNDDWQDGSIIYLGFTDILTITNLAPVIAGGSSKIKTNTGANVTTTAGQVIPFIKMTIGGNTYWNQL